ncbi:MAG: ATP-binding protein [Pseudomonadales bacterium]|nr:ATP-binding protein [Pseudomonadales bacterium]
MYQRMVRLPKKLKESFFLWGPRQVGKSTLLKQLYADALWVDLLKADEFRRYTQHPERLREELLAIPHQKAVIIDEIQKVPQLLDEVHWLIENKQIHFALCGSSARKVKSGHANLLGGRAIRYELYGLVSAEIGAQFDLDRLLNNGYIPNHYDKKNARRHIQAYISDYLKEEIAAEGLVRNLPAFADFLDIVALTDGELVNYANIARDCGVANNTVKEYFQILQDTLLGCWLPAYRKRPKRRVSKMPKFYFNDIGVVNLLAKRHTLEQGSELYGKAFENWIFHELKCHSQYSELFYQLSYWRLSSGLEVDFIINDMDIAIEAKASKRIKNIHLKGLREVIKDQPTIKQRVIVCLEDKERLTEDGIRILPAHQFCKRLWNNELIN